MQILSSASHPTRIAPELSWSAPFGADVQLSGFVRLQISQTPKYTSLWMKA